MKPANGSTSSGFRQGSALPPTGATLQVGQEALRWDEGGVEKTVRNKKTTWCWWFRNLKANHLGWWNLINNGISTIFFPQLVFSQDFERIIGHSMSSRKYPCKKEVCIGKMSASPKNRCCFLGIDPTTSHQQPSLATGYMWHIYTITWKTSCC